MELAYNLATLALYDIVSYADDSAFMAFQKGATSLLTVCMPLQGSCSQAPHASGIGVQSGHSGSVRHSDIC